MCERRQSIPEMRISTSVDVDWVSNPEITAFSGPGRRHPEATETAGA